MKMFPITVAFQITSSGSKILYGLQPFANMHWTKFIIPAFELWIFEVFVFQFKLCVCLCV